MEFMRKDIATRRRASWGFPRFVASRLQAGAGQTHRLSKPFLRIAIAAVAISVSAMLISVAVARGFQKAIASRATLFVGHVQVVSMDGNASLEQKPIKRSSRLEADLRDVPSLRALQRFALKGAVIKTRESMQGCVVKGVDSSMDWSLLQPFMVRGRTPNFTDSVHFNEALIAEVTAQRLNLDTGQQLTIYFVQNPPRVRQFRIVGIYATQLTDFDSRYVFAHLSYIQRLNGWTPTQIGGYEMHVQHMRSTDGAVAAVLDAVDANLEREGTLLRVVDVRDKYSSLFGWLDLLDVNVAVLLTVLLSVAGINMITALLILILERTRMIGLLKALGARNRQLRAIFIMQAAYILAWGLFIGNAVGIGLLMAQQQWAFARLNPEDYYIDHVPVSLSFPIMLTVNVVTVAVTIAMLLGPSAIIAKMNAGESARFE